MPEKLTDKLVQHLAAPVAGNRIVYDTEVKGFGAMLFANSQEPETDRKAHMASNSGAVTLGDVAGKLPMLDVTCSKCDRRGRLSVANLIAQHGADMRLPDLREILAG